MSHSPTQAELSDAVSPLPILAAASPAAPSRRRRATVFGTTTVVAFALTLLAASVAVLSGISPMHVPVSRQADIATLLFLLPMLALLLAMAAEVTRIATRRSQLPTVVEVRRIAWADRSGRD